MGGGSIGARHARNLIALGADVTVTDPDPSRAAALSLPSVPLDLDRLDGYEGVVVASPTARHLEQARAALATGARVLVEKPLAASGDGLADVIGSDRLMVGYNLRFHEPLRRVVGLVRDGAAGQVSSVRVWFGSWLPDWRPAVDYRDTYSARADLGGGVLLDAIHELDLLVWLCGPDEFRVVGAVVDRIGPLEIDVEDTVRAVLRHPDGTVAEVALDYLSRRYRRGIEVIGDRATVRFDWARKVVEVEDAVQVRAEEDATPISRSYELEAEHFLAFVAGRAAPPVDGPAAAASIRLADDIRRAAGCLS